jgi:lipopolysaccharide export system permease protein
MKILFYIAKKFNQYFISVMLILLLVDLLFYTINEFKNVGAGYAALDAIYYVLLSIPRKSYALTPWVSLIATMLSLGNIAKHYELIALQVAGFSPWKIAQVVVISNIPALIILVVLGEVVAPKFETIASNVRASGLMTAAVIVTDDGMWARSAQKFFHISNMVDKNTLKDVTVYTLDDNLKVSSIVQADSAKNVDGSWELMPVVTTLISDNKIEIVSDNKLAYKNFININALDATNARYLDRMSVTKLYSTIKLRKQNHLSVREYQAALWKKINQPLAIIMMIILAVPFTFSSLRDASSWVKILVGIIIAFVFHIFNSVMGSVAVLSNFSVIFANLIPTLIVLLISIILFMRINT